MEMNIDESSSHVNNSELLRNNDMIDNNEIDNDNVLFPSKSKRRRRRIVIEDYTKFSDSKIWDLMMRFYDQNGISSWADGIVPHFISSNPFIGKTYAKILSGFYRDLKHQREVRGVKGRANGISNHIDDNQCFYIVEIGGGTGKLAFYILKALEEMKDIIGIPMKQIVYVLTDFTESNIKFWRQQEDLRPFVDSGQLDFAKFEAVNDTQLKLLNSGKILKKGDVQNPICIVANYLIDTLCNDAFQVEAGVIKEGLVSVGVDEEYKIKYDEEGNVDYNDPQIINSLMNEYQYNEVSCNYYSDCVPQDDVLHFSEIMAWYQKYYDDKQGASFLIPVGFLKAVRHLSDLSSGNALIISGDKGNSNPDHFRGISDPHMALHGSFSLMVNFHAIGLYVKSRGGVSWYGSQEESALQVNCFLLNEDNGAKDVICTKANRAESDMNSLKKQKFAFLSHSFDDTINNFNPNDFFVLQKSLKEEASPTLLSIVSLLKLSNWDPEIFYKFRDVVLTSIQSYGQRLHNDLISGIPKLWDNYYHLGDSDHGKDIPFELGRLYYGLSLYDKALEFYQTSIKLYGNHHITAHNTGLCRFSLLQYTEAKACFEKAIEINPQYEKSRNWLTKVEKELAGDD